jgi:hypothetical protein
MGPVGAKHITDDPKDGFIRNLFYAYNGPEKGLTPAQEFVAELSEGVTKSVLAITRSALPSVLKVAQRADNHMEEYSRRKSREKLFGFLFILVFTLVAVLLLALASSE